MAKVGGKRAREKTEEGKEGKRVDGEGDVEPESKSAKVEGPAGPTEAEQKSAKLKAEGVEDLAGGCEPPATTLAALSPTPMASMGIGEYDSDLPPCVESRPATKAKPRLEVLYTFYLRGTDKVERAAGEWCSAWPHPIYPMRRARLTSSVPRDDRSSWHQ